MELTMKVSLVTKIADLKLTGKTIADQNSGAKQKNVQKGAEKKSADPFFEVKSPRANEGNRITVTFAGC